MIPIPKGGKVCSTNADLYRSIAISCILSKILDFVILDQQADSLATSDYQFKNTKKKIGGGGWDFLFFFSNFTIF